MSPATLILDADAVRNLLNHLYDFAYLRHHPLATAIRSPITQTTEADPGSGLHAYLLAVLEQLQPVGVTAGVEGAWRRYRLLRLIYVERQPPSQVMAQLNLSRSTFFREQRTALSLLAAQLGDSAAESNAWRMPPTVGSSIPYTADLVGRQRELQACRTLLAQQGWLVITGLAGAGKTTLAAALAQQAAQQMPVLWLQFQPGYPTSLNSVLHEFAVHLAYHGITDFRTLLAASAAHDAPRSTPSGSHTSLTPQVHFLLRLLQTKPAFIVVDNSHLVNDSSLSGFLGLLCRQASPDGVQLLLVGRTQPTWVQHGVSFPLPGLSREDMQSLLARAGLTQLAPDLSRRLHAKTDGNPMFLRFFMAQVQSAQAASGAAPSIETLIAHLEKTPDVRRYLLENIFQELTPPERALLEVAAIFRTAFDEYDHDLQQLLVAVGVLDVGATLDRLVTRHIVTRLYPSADVHIHQLLRDDAFSRLQARPADRQRIHAAAASYYDRRRDYLEAAYHYGHAGACEHAAQLLAEQIESVLNRGQAAAAQRLLDDLLETGLSLARRGLAYQSLGEIALMQGNYAPALAYFQRALDLNGTEAPSVILCVKIGRVYQEQGEFKTSLEWLLRAEQRVRATDDVRLQAQVTNAIAWLYHQQGEYDRAQRWVESSLAVIEHSPYGRELAAALSILAGIMFIHGQWEEARTLTQRVLHFRMQSGDLIGQAAARGNLAILDFHLGDLIAARDGHLAALDLDTELGNRPGMCATEFNLGEVFFYLGEWAQAQAHYDQALALAHDTGQRGMAARSHLGLTELQLTQGDREAAGAHLQASRALQDELNTARLQSDTCRMQAALLLALDQAPAAAAWIEQSLSAAQAAGQTVSGLRARRVAAQVEAARRNGAAAGAHLEKAYTQSRALHSRLEEAETLLVRARIEAAHGNLLEAATTAATAAALYQGMGAAVRAAVCRQMATVARESRGRGRNQMDRGEGAHGQRRYVITTELSVPC